MTAHGSAGPPWWRPFARRRHRRALKARAAVAGLARQLAASLPRQLAEQVGRDATAHGLIVVGDCSAAELVLPDGRLVPRRMVEQVVPANDAAIKLAAEIMVEQIFDSHGPGRVWTLPGLEVVHPYYDDGMLVRLHPVTDLPVVILRAVYFHERDAAPPPPPRAIELEPWTR